jgi:hypothetical protein
MLVLSPAGHNHGPSEMQKIFIGYVFRAERRALARIWQGVTDADAVGSPVEVREGCGDW